MYISFGGQGNVTSVLVMVETVQSGSEVSLLKITVVKKLEELLGERT